MRCSSWWCLGSLVVLAACQNEGSRATSAGTTSVAGNNAQGGTAPNQGGGGAGSDFASSASALASAIDAYDTSVDFTLMLANQHGTFFSHSHGASTPDTSYESASTSKWVTSAVLMHLVEKTAQAATPFSLGSRPEDILTSWTSDNLDLRSRITLETLLSFRSGLQPADGSDANCVSVANATLATCVAVICGNAATSTLVPGDDFVYGSHHMQVAGLMAMRQQGTTTWGEIFDAFKADTGLFPTSVYDLPSTDNPRLAGGMHWTATEYMAFLGKLFDGSLLSRESARAMFADHTPDGAVNIAYSPVLDGLGEMWHYGLGNWLECRSPSWQSSCEAAGRHSSPGAYGAYPFVDFGAGFYGILARQGPIGTFRDGMVVYRDLESLINALAAVAP
jgi:CubicO group peptidase (beta-lactamase class C family)